MGIYIYRLSEKKRTISGSDIYLRTYHANAGMALNRKTRAFTNEKYIDERLYVGAYEHGEMVLRFAAGTNQWLDCNEKRYSFAGVLVDFGLKKPELRFIQSDDPYTVVKRTMIVDAHNDSKEHVFEEFEGQVYYRQFINGRDFYKRPVIASTTGYYHLYLNQLKGAAA